MSQCTSSKWHRDSNPQPFKRESTPITTRPGLPPYFKYLLTYISLRIFDRGVPNLNEAVARGKIKFV